MRLITKRDVIKQAIISFGRLWGNGSYPADKRGINVGAELKVLDAEKATADEVNELIGNNSWTALKCNECGVDASAVIELGENPVYESTTVRVCIDCINKSVSLNTFCTLGYISTKSL